MTEGRLRTASGGGALVLPGLRLMASGTGVPQWNSGDVDDVDLARRQLDSARWWYADRRTPFGLHVPQGMEWGHGEHVLTRRLMAARAPGWRPAPTSGLTTADGTTIRLRRAGTDDVERVLSVDATVFGDDSDVSRRWLVPALHRRAAGVVTVAIAESVDGEPLAVATGTLARGLAGRTVGVSGVAVHEHVRSPSPHRAPPTSGTPTSDPLRPFPYFPAPFQEFDVKRPRKRHFPKKVRVEGGGEGEKVRGEGRVARYPVERCRCHDVPWLNVRNLPYDDPGDPDLRSPWRFLLWVGAHQRGTLAIGVGWGVIWMVGQALVPVAVGRGIDEGVVTGDGHALLMWSGAVLALAAIQAFAGVMRHRISVSNWLQASFRCAQLIGHHAARTGEALPRTVPTGEVVSTVTNDSMRLGGGFDVSARFAGAIASYVVVAVVLIRISVPLGLLVLIGVPVLTAALGVLVKPLQRRQTAQREQAGALTTLGADTVAGLRVLRGIGGEQTFVGRYRAQSEQVRLSGVRVAGVQATLDAAQVLLPGVFVVLVTWLGAHEAVRGDISVGDLVTFYALSAFLVTPLRTATETLDKVTRAHIAASKIINVLRVGPAVLDRTNGQRTDALPAEPLHDPTSGVTIQPGRFTAVVSERPEESASLADRLGRFVEVPNAPVLLGEDRIDVLPLGSVRRHVVVSEGDPRLFTGPLRHQLAGPGGADDEAVRAALDAASAQDVLDALPQGLDSQVEERGRSFSGGQRQRLSLARALLTDAPALVLVEPTSAVDAHTEARVAAQLRSHRAGRTTVVMTASPLLLDHTDHVVFLEGGELAAEGTHRELLRDNAAYRRTVIRGEDE